MRPALAARLAGIPQRIGLGLGSQRYFITNPGIDQSHFHDMPIEWLAELMRVMGVPFGDTEPDLRLPPAALRRVSERFGAMPRPWLALALGGSHPQKDWSDAHWTTFVDTVRRRAPGTVFFVGGPDNTVRAQAFIEHTTGAGAVNACDLPIVDAAALLRLTDLFVGPDSGPMNLAAAGQTPAFGSVRLDAAAQLLALHSRHRAGRRPARTGRHEPHLARRRDGADRAVSSDAEDLARALSPHAQSSS